MSNWKAIAGKTAAFVIIIAMIAAVLLPIKNSGKEAPVTASAQGALVKGQSLQRSTQDVSITAFAAPIDKAPSVVTFVAVDAEIPEIVNSDAALYLAADEMSAAVQRIPAVQLHKEAQAQADAEAAAQRAAEEEAARKAAEQKAAEEEAARKAEEAAKAAEEEAARKAAEQKAAEEEAARKAEEQKAAEEEAARKAAEQKAAEEEAAKKADEAAKAAEESAKAEEAAKAQEASKAEESKKEESSQAETSKVETPAKVEESSKEASEQKAAEEAAKAEAEKKAAEEAAKAEAEKKAAEEAAKAEAEKKAAEEAAKAEAEKAAEEAAAVDDTPLNSFMGVNSYNGHTETYYNMYMGELIDAMNRGGWAYNDCINKDIIDNILDTSGYWIRSDGCKMFGDYIILAASASEYARGSIVLTSLGWGMVIDRGVGPGVIDIAVNW